MKHGLDTTTPSVRLRPKVPPSKSTPLKFHSLFGCWLGKAPAWLAALICWKQPEQSNQCWSSCPASEAAAQAALCTAAFAFCSHSCFVGLQICIRWGLGLLGTERVVLAGSILRALGCTGKSKAGCCTRKGCGCTLLSSAAAGAPVISQQVLLYLS